MEVIDNVEVDLANLYKKYNNRVTFHGISSEYRTLADIKVLFTFKDK